MMAAGASSRAESLSGRPAGGHGARRLSAAATASDTGSLRPGLGTAAAVTVRRRPRRRA